MTTPSSPSDSTASASPSLPSPYSSASIQKKLLAIGLPGFGEELDLKSLVQLFNRRKGVMIQIVLATIIFGMLLAFVLPPRFEATAIVMLDVRRTEVVNMEDVMSGLRPDAAVVRSEMDIIRSRTMIGRVVDKLNLVNESAYNFSLKPDPLAALSNLFKKSPQDDKISQRAGVIDEVERLLDVSNDGRSYAIKITFKAPTPTDASRIANAFADAYLVDQLEAKYEATQRANTWLNERIGKLKENVETADKAVADYRREHNLTQSNGTTVASQQLGEINSQLVAARAERSQAEARLRGARQMAASGGGVEAVADVLSSELIQKLREQESEVRREIADMSMRYGDRHPTIINKRAELADLNNKIREEVQKIVASIANQVDVARAKENSLAGELARLEGRNNVDSAASVTLRQLEREAEANRTLYENFLNRFKQTSEQQELQQADARIISAAEPPVKQSFPNPFMFFILSLLMGIGLGGATAYLIEYFDRGFRGATQIEQLTNHPAIGLVPSLKGTTEKSPEDYILEKPLSSYSEALRSIRTAIHFSNVDKPPKVVMFTSALPGEGKSTLCMSLCRSLALAGNKVLMIEADLRRPRIRKALKAPEGAPGLQAVLSGEKPLKEAVLVDKPSGLRYIISAGKTPSPQDLLGSHQMKRLLEICAEQFDLVVIDTPPIMAVSDAAIVGRIADASVFVVRWAETPRDVAVSAIKQLTNVNVRLAGVVLSQVDLDQHARYGYGDQGYYYGRYREYYSN